MRFGWWIVAFIVSGAFAQTNSGIARHINFGSSLPATCSPNTGDIFFLTSAGPTGNLYTCTAPNTWGFSVSSLSVGNTVLTNAEYSNGTCTTAATINYANGYNQTMTLTASDTCALTFTQPSGVVASIRLRIIGPASGTGQISGGYWPSGTGFTTAAVPTLANTSSSWVFAVCVLNGTVTSCQLSQ